MHLELISLWQNATNSYNKSHSQCRAEAERTYLVDVVSPCPGETAGVVGTQDMERGVVEAGPGWVQHGHQHPSVCLPRLSPCRQFQRTVQEGQGRRVRSAAHSLHERSATLSISVQNRGMVPLTG